MVRDFVTNIIRKYAPDEQLQKLLIGHSSMVAAKALEVARDAGLLDKIDAGFVEEAAMLHDIGVTATDAPSIHCHGKLPYICHGVAGARILADEGLPEAYGRVCMRHTGAGITPEEIAAHSLPLPPGDYMPETLEEKLICYADKFYSKSGDPLREKTLEQVERSMSRHGEDTLKRFRELHSFFTGSRNQ